MGVWWHALAFVTHERAKMSHKPVRNVTQAGPKCHTRAKMSHSHVIITCLARVVWTVDGRCIELQTGGVWREWPNMHISFILCPVYWIQPYRFNTQSGSLLYHMALLEKMSRIISTRMKNMAIHYGISGVRYFARLFRLSTEQNLKKVFLRLWKFSQDPDRIYISLINFNLYEISGHFWNYLMIKLFYTRLVSSTAMM